jgi:hypothetical protein
MIVMSTYIDYGLEVIKEVCRSGQRWNMTSSKEVSFPKIMNGQNT